MMNSETCKEIYYIVHTLVGLLIFSSTLTKCKTDGNQSVIRRWSMLPIAHTRCDGKREQWGRLLRQCAEVRQTSLPRWRLGWRCCIWSKSSSCWSFVLDKSSSPSRTHLYSQHTARRMTTNKILINESNHVYLLTQSGAESGGSRNMAFSRTW